MNKCWKFIYANPAVRADIQVGMEMKLDPVGSTVRYEMMKLCTGSVRTL